MSETSMLYWFHKLKDAGVPVPKTELVPLPGEAHKPIWDVFDGKVLTTTPTLKTFNVALLGAADEVGGFPIFLRTHTTSAKHDWVRTCYVKEEQGIMNHVLAIISYSECVAMHGELDWSVWAVRELLPTTPAFRAFNSMPIVCEFRIFAREGELICHHPYWPPASIEGHTKEKDWRQLLDDLQREDPDEAIAIALSASKAVPGFSWSIDVLKTERGWFVTDLALMRESYHWPGCPHAK